MQIFAFYKKVDVYRAAKSADPADHVDFLVPGDSSKFSPRRFQGSPWTPLISKLEHMKLLELIGIIVFVQSQGCQ